MINKISLQQFPKLNPSLPACPKLTASVAKFPQAIRTPNRRSRAGPTANRPLTPFPQSLCVVINPTDSLAMAINSFAGLGGDVMEAMLSVYSCSPASWVGGAPVVRLQAALPAGPCAPWHRQASRETWGRKRCSFVVEEIRNTDREVIQRMGRYHLVSFFLLEG
jgi:hypothetical protein